MKEQIFTTNGLKRLHTESNSTSSIVIEGDLNSGEAKLQFRGGVEIEGGEAEIGSIFTLTHGLDRDVYLLIEGGGSGLNVVVTTANVL